MSAPRSKVRPVDEIGLSITFNVKTHERRLTLFVPDGPSMQVTMSEDEAWVVAQSLCRVPRIPEEEDES
jgi:hypothetical protein